MAQYIPLSQHDIPSSEHDDSGPAATSDFAVPQWSLRGDKDTLRSNYLKHRLIVALPRFAQPGGIKDRSIGPTSYLDALRGYAACIVFMSHAFNTEQNTWRNQPFVSMFFSGMAMVSLFFVISGYALGYRLLILIRRHESDRLLSALASSSFRRYIRLYLSSCIAIILTLPLVRLRLYNGMIIRIHKDGLWEQVTDCAYDIFRFFNPFADIRGWIYKGFFHPKYLGVLWTIPVEYRGSVALFGFCTAACKLTTRSRMVMTWIVIIACYCWQAVYVSEFLAGLWLADMTLSRHPERLAGGVTRGPERNHPMAVPIPSPQPPSSISTSNPSNPYQDNGALLPKVGHAVLLIVGLVLLGQPNTADSTLGIWGTFPWGYLHAIEPPWWDSTGRHIFWQTPGSIMVMYALEFYPGGELQKPLQWRISQYVGDLSFGIYIVHVPTVFAVLYHFVNPLRQQYLGESYVAYLPGVVITTVTVLVVADYFTRIDTRVVRFARWLQDMVFVRVQ